MSIITRKETNKAHDHLSERRVDIKVELPLEIVRPKLAEVGLIPDDDVRVPNTIEARPARQEGIDCWWKMLEILLDEFRLKKEGGGE